MIVSRIALQGATPANSTNRRDSAKRAAMADVVLSLIPVFSLIALGGVLRRYKVLTPDGWAALDFAPPSQGEYGFMLLGVSGVGRKEPEPKSGDDPQVTVVVDWDAPHDRARLSR